MRCWTVGALALLAIGAADALDNCDSNTLVDAYEGLNVNTELVECIQKNNFSAALDGSVDLTSVDAASAPEQVKTICASSACTTIISALVSSANFNLTNCIVGDGIVLMTEISNLDATCKAITTQTTTAPATTAPASTTAAPVATTAAPVATTAAPVSTTAAPVATTAAPVSTTAAPVATTAAPVATTAAPVATTAAPVATTAAPVATTAAPVSTTAAPVATTAAPVATTAAPVATTAAPVATTAAPVATTAAPIATTAAPVATTSAPTATTAAPSTQQQTSFSTLDSDSGSAAGGVSTGKYCDK